MMEAQSDIRDILTELQNTPEIISRSHYNKMAHCLKHFQARGLTLATCADARHLNRAVATLKKYARELRLRFPDYVPLVTRTKEERERKSKKK